MNSEKILFINPILVGPKVVLKLLSILTCLSRTFFFYVSHPYTLYISLVIFFLNLLTRKAITITKTLPLHQIPEKQLILTE